MTISDLELKVILSGVPYFEIDTQGSLDHLADLSFDKFGNLIEFKVRVKTQKFCPFWEMDAIHYSITQTTEFWEINIIKGEDVIILTDEQEKLFDEIIRDKMTIS